jgi:signal transduction histidine kinase
MWNCLAVLAAIGSEPTCAAARTYGTKIQAWGFPGTVLQFALEPTHHRTVVLGVGTAVAFILAVAVLLAVRLAQSKDPHRVGAAVGQAERERIARDIHDTLLQGTQALLFRLQMWQDYPEIPEPLRNEIAKVVLQTKSIVVESRARILMMRQAPPGDLLEALAAIDDEDSTEESATFGVGVDGEDRSPSMDARDQGRECAGGASTWAGVFGFNS